MQTPDIAVIIPTRNRCDVLPRAIRSVLNQSFMNFELIVVDDGSSDSTSSYLSGLSDPHLVWYRLDQPHGGNAARNYGVHRSTAPLLTFLDSDDEYYPHRLAEIVSFFAGTHDANLHLSSFILHKKNGPAVCINPVNTFAPEELERYLVAYCLFLGCSGISVRRSAFDNVGGFNEALTRIQDRDLLLRLARHYSCTTSATVNWIKYCSHDSISRQRAGQITALVNLFAHHNHLKTKYPTLFGYLIARQIVNPLAQVKVGRLIGALRELNHSTGLLSQLPRFLAHYYVGKRYRRILRSSITVRK